MNLKIAKSLASRTIVFAILLITLEVASSDSYGITQALGVDVSYVILPLVITSAIIYGVALTDILFTGETFKILRRGTAGFAIGLFLSLVIIVSPYLQGGLPLGFWILIGVVIITGAYVTNELAKIHNIRSIRIVSFSIALLALACVLGLPWQHSIFGFSDSLGNVIFWSLAIASALCLLGFLSASRNPYLSYIGKKFGSASGILTISSLLIFLLFYAFDLRPILVGAYSSYILPFEWGVVCVVCIVVYRNAKSYVAEFLAEDLVLGKWTRLFQRIEQKKDKLGEMSEIIEKFLVEGSKEGIIVYLTSTLIENHVSTRQTEEVIGRLVRYQDIPLPKLVFLSKLESRERENKMRRREVLQETLIEAGNVLNVKVPIEGLKETQVIEE
jgi:hypothetical protein